MCMCRQKTCFLAAGAADLDATEVNYEALESVMCDVIKIRLLSSYFLSHPYLFEHIFKILHVTLYSTS